jgi:ssRNA-specific RNase YbeY (16S rRNA maturation enzyme)
MKFSEIQICQQKMSAENYQIYCEQKAHLETRRKELAAQLCQVEQEMEHLRKEYAVNCDHPTRVLSFPVCGVCNHYVPREQ